MKRIFRLIVLTLLILPALSLSVVFAASDKEITVTVKDENDDGVGGINVTLSGPDGYTPNTIPTSSNGSAIFDDMTDNGEYTASVSLPSSSDWKFQSGETSSKSVEISSTNKNETIIFNVEQKSASTDDTPKILSVILPPVFTKVGSTTTLMSKIAADDIVAVTGFTLDDPSANKIVFSEAVDLSDESLADKFAELDKYVVIDEKGRILLDSEEIPALDKRAQITMRNMHLVSGSSPVIVEDGEASSKVSNIKYQNETLTFDVTGFSTYAFRPTVKVTAEEEVNDPAFTINGEVDDLDAKIDIYLGEEQLAQGIEPDDGGQFVFSYTLQNKDNTFRVVASSENGEASDVEFDVSYLGGSQEEGTKENGSNSLILVASVLLGLSVAGGLIFYFMRRAKKNKELSQPKSVGEKDLDTPNPPMPFQEKEDLTGDRIGHTDLGSIEDSDS